VAEAHQGHQQKNRVELYHSYADWRLLLYIFFTSLIDNNIIIGFNRKVECKQKQENDSPTSLQSVKRALIVEVRCVTESSVRKVFNNSTEIKCEETEQQKKSGL
jgi:hypothetical protein